MSRGRKRSSAVKLHMDGFPGTGAFLGGFWSRFSPEFVLCFFPTSRSAPFLPLECLLCSPSSHGAEHPGQRHLLCPPAGTVRRQRRHKETL